METILQKWDSLTRTKTIDQNSPEKMYDAAGMNAADIDAKDLTVLGVARVGAMRA